MRRGKSIEIMLFVTFWISCLVNYNVVRYIPKATAATKSYTTRVYYEHSKYVDLLHTHTPLLVFIEWFLLYITILWRERVGGVGCLEETALGGKFVHRAMHINYGHFLQPFIRPTLSGIRSRTLQPSWPSQPPLTPTKRWLRQSIGLRRSRCPRYTITADAVRSGKIISLADIM